MDPKLKARIEAGKKSQQNVINEADKSLSSLNSSISQARKERLHIMFDHLKETSNYIQVMADSSIDLIEKRKTTIPTLHYIADQFEKRKNDKKIADTVGKSLGVISGFLALTGVGAPIAAAFAASSIAIELGADIGTTCLGNEDFEKFTIMIADDNCMSDLFSKAMEHITIEIDFFHDLGVDLTTICFLIKEFKIKKNSNFETFSMEKNHLEFLDQICVGKEKLNETNFEDLTKKYGFNDYNNFAKKTGKFCFSVYKIYKYFFPGDPSKIGFIGKIQAKVMAKISEKVSENTISKCDKAFKFGSKVFGVLGIGLDLGQIFVIWICDSTSKEKILMDDIAEKLKDENPFFEEIKVDLLEIIT